MMNIIWALLLIGGFLGLVITSNVGADGTGALLDAAMNAVSLGIRLAGGFALWSGMIAILEKAGAVRAISRLLAKPMGLLFPGVTPDSPAGQAMLTNLSANMLGLGNAATPMGLKAMGLMADQGGSALATDAMCMFLVINASSLQLFPSSVISLRAAAGAASPASIVLPTLAATAVSTVVGIAACLLLRRRSLI